MFHNVKINQMNHHEGALQNWHELTDLPMQGARILCCYRVCQKCVPNFRKSALWI